MIVTVPWPNLGFLRRVYPGFLQLSGFMSMNLDRHVDAHLDQFKPFDPRATATARRRTGPSMTSISR